MSEALRRGLWPAVVLLLALTLITGIAYPVLVTGLAQLAFPHQATGSLIVLGDGRAVGSALVGQSFSDARYFWGRPSAAGAGYDASASGASNLGPTSVVLLKRVSTEVERLQRIHGDGPVPVDLVTTSASGLDPHISPAAAEYQVARVATARGLDLDDVRAVVARHTEGRVLGFLGEPSVNVLELNLDLDGLLP